MHNEAVTYVFAGLVHPERADVNVRPLRLEISSLDGTFGGQIFLSIQRSQISVVFNANAPIEDLKTVRNGIRDVVQSAVNLLGYFVGCGYEVEIIQLLNHPSFGQQVFGVDVPALSEYREKMSLEVGRRFEDYYSLLQDENGLYLRRALADLSLAIKSPSDTGFYCFRAIESIKQYFSKVKSISKDKAAWEMTRNELDVDRVDIDFVKNFADPVRHGDILNLSGQERDQIFVKTWSIIYKYIEYLQSA